MATRHRVALRAIATTMVLLGSALPIAHTANAFGSGTFTCEGLQVFKYSDSSIAYTYDGNAQCPVRARWRLSSGAVGPFGYAVAGYVAYAPGVAGTKAGGNHGAQNFQDTWVTANT
jgi:hypothetical protein